MWNPAHRRTPNHGAAVRAAAADGLGFLGIDVDGALNERIEGDGDISTPGAAVRTLVVHAREDVEVVPDRVERQVEPPRELPQVEARIALQELEDPVTRCQ